MARVDVELPEQDLERLRSCAERRRVPVSDALRQLVADGLRDDPTREPAAGVDTDARRARALGVLGLFRDREGRSDVAENHDRFLGDTFRP